jgi:hypothetical protein
MQFYFQPRTADELAACEERVALQLRVLLEHRKTTIAALKRIKEREDARTEFGNCLIRFAETVDSESAERAKACLVLMSDATVAVVAAISEWRELLTEPRPLLWRSTNYVLKMGNDMEFLEGDPALQVMRYMIEQVAYGNR